MINQLKDSKKDILNEDNISKIQFDAVFVDSFDQYQQKDYDRILNT